MKGFELEEDKNGYVNDIRRGGSFGVAGVGMGIDLGATYKLTDAITLSAAVLDLGFISWSKGSSHWASSAASREYNFSATDRYDAEEFRDMLVSGKVANVEMLQIKQGQGKARTTGVGASIEIGRAHV